VWFAFNTYRRLIGLQIRGQLQYRVGFILEVIATTVIMFTIFGAVALVFQRFNHLSGWTLGEVAFLWGMVEFAFGTMDLIFSGFDPGNFGQRVRRGSFDQILLRPVNITLQVLGSEFVVRRLGRILEGALILWLALNLVDIDWTLMKVIYLPFVIAGQVCFFGGLFIVGATITFWTVESIEAINIFTYGGSEMIAYPMHIYPDWLRRFFTYLIPAGLLNYYPALFFFDKPDPFNLPFFVPFLAPVAGLGTLLAALLFWRFGVQYYQSTGS
jgi:ABC-2 type transport system permease protein